jgi:hypothetical protein
MKQFKTNFFKRLLTSAIVISASVCALLTLQNCERELFVEPEGEEVVVTSKNTIRGVVTENDNSGRLDKQKRVAGCGASVRKVEQVNRTASETDSLGAISNANGEFVISGIKGGKYSYFIKYKNYKMEQTEYLNIPTTEGLVSEVRTDVVLEDSKVKISKLIITQDIKNAYTAAIAPSSSVASIEINFAENSVDRSVSIVNASGSVIGLTQANGKSVALDVSTLPKGSSTLQVIENSEVKKKYQLIKE